MEERRRPVWSLDRRIGRFAYLATGVALMALKYLLDRAIARSSGYGWQLWSYFLWPGDARTVFALNEEGRRTALLLLLTALPFIAAGVLLTVQRLRAVGLPIGLVALFFVPFVNVALFVVLLVAPDQPPPLADAEAAARKWMAHARRTAASFRRSATLAWIVTVPAAIGLSWLGANWFQQYGWGLFVALPFLLGLVSVALFCAAEPRPWRECILVMLGALMLTSASFVLIAFEGLLCVAMAFPIAFVLALLGAFVAYRFQIHLWGRARLGSLCLLLGLLAPALMAAESASAPQPRMRAVVTSIVVDAPPAVVWRRVVEFPPLPPPSEWLFRTGIACPTSAWIEGEGVGAVRHCVFTTGEFVEPITAWDEPRLLRFAVTSQPPPMREWSPFEIHPPHLDGFLVSREGQFRLESLPDGRTLLEGTTWYSNRMWPAPYWSLWSDSLIHAIHRRVLEHVRGLAEGS
jgi:hypothetical protein